MTFSEENYLKIIYHLGQERLEEVTTNAIADVMQTKASSVTDMIKKLHEKGWVEHKKYQGVSLTKEGEKNALFVIHIQSDKLIEELDKLLLYPEKDPHGDPIPDKFGHMPSLKSELLSQMKPNEVAQCVGVRNTSKEFLQYLNKIDISIGKEIKILEIHSFDNSIEIQLDSRTINISSMIAENIYVKKNK